MSRNYTLESTLVDRLMLDDTEAFEELFHRYCLPLYGYCLDKLDSHDDSKRIVRKIFIDVWEIRHSLPLNFSLSAHLYTQVRKAVVQCINDKLCNTDETIGNRIIPSFNVVHLKKARQPVKIVFQLKDRTTNTTITENTTSNKDRTWNHYLDTYVLKNVRYAFQKVMHLM